MPKTSESGTTELAKLECNRRRWAFEQTSWTERYPRGNGKFVTRRKDLLGFIDALAFPDRGGVYAIQYTSRSNMASRLSKIREHDSLPLVLGAGWPVCCWSFRPDDSLYEIELRAISGFPGYVACSHGAIWSSRYRTKGPSDRTPWPLVPMREMALTDLPNGYRQIELYHDGQATKQSVHRVILEAFRGSPRPEQQARHLDGDRTNNRLANLAWGTKAENEADKVVHGTTARGESHGMAKLTESLVRNARSRVASGDSVSAVARALGVERGAIRSLLQRKTWKHVQ